MTKDVQKEVLGYAFNLFAFPPGYFEERTAEELHICEEARQELIRLQNEPKSLETPEAREKRKMDEFLAEFYEED